ncbi:MAG: hypothetical protein AAFN79_00620 [Pseudomonadota bacterium]
MRRAAIFALGLTALAAPALGCEAPADEGLLYFSCAPKAELLLLPEDAGVPSLGDDEILVTGGYTATDRREGGRPKPVGLFVSEGRVASREYVRFDGVLTVEAGRPTLHYRRRVSLGGAVWDLEDKAARAAFLEAARARGAGVAQSHLLIIDGAVDTAPVDGAPRFRRRILFQTDEGIGIWDSGAEMLTLDAAARSVHGRFAPEMALNLDMGSYDFCQIGEARCGALSYAQTGKLSNMLRLGE